MTQRHNPNITLEWMREGTDHLLTIVEMTDDHELSASSRLPLWTRAQVVGHVARNAEALARLATWASTGVETPMYASREQRNDEIESTAALPPPALRALLIDSAVQLDDALDELDDTSWTATVRSALGRIIPAAEIPWMRVREVWLHAIDVGANIGFGDLPAGAIDLLLDDTVAVLSSREGCPSIILAPTDRSRTWKLGSTAPDSEVDQVPAALLVEWLTGRAPNDRASSLPPVPAWI